MGGDYILGKNPKGAVERINIGAKAVVRFNVGEYSQINSPGNSAYII